jgi:hypothetical protein
VEQKEPSYTAGVNANWCNNSGKKIGGFLKIHNGILLTHEKE